ncbi:hypothetical protein [Paenibacillus hamazuiensis]|uniref:hypothetical protein n=1 Tax=Paenibacillus hamazuiensis TaxID=2936508 RepID=UPI00200F04EC|nr:hypothetical protein [Paenibacillus hamazuiensis]
MDPHKVAAVLKEYEVYIYRIAHYLLQKESSAIAAAENTLLELAQTPFFLTGCEAERKRRAKMTAIKHALSLAKHTAGRK